MQGVFAGVGREEILWSALVVLGIVSLGLIYLLRRQRRLLLTHGSALHHLSFNLHNDLQRRDQASTSGVVRVVLTGGPCAGKSSAESQVSKYAKAQGFDVYTQPETATLLKNCGLAVPSTEEGLLTFQTSILKTQLQIETALSDVIEDTGRPSILLLDRGVMDGKAYISEETWHTVLRRIDRNSSIEDIEKTLLSRYDAIVHMVTAADGAENHYKCGDTVDDDGHRVLRMETPEAARVLDARMWELWKDHPNHIRVPNFGDFSDKLQEVARSIVDVARQAQPTFAGGVATPLVRQGGYRPIAAI